MTEDGHAVAQYGFSSHNTFFFRVKNITPDRSAALVIRNKVHLKHGNVLMSNRLGRFLLLCLAIRLFSLASPACVDELVKRTEDVVYGRKAGMALTLDVFQPAKPNGSGLLFLVNGGWLSSKSTPLMVTIRPDDYRVFLERGYTVFAVVTSSQPKFTIAEEIDDVLRSVRFVRRHAGHYGIDPQRLGVLGSSSGGHLTLSIAARGGPGQSDSPDPVERESSAVQAATCFFPPTDFLNYGSVGVNGAGVGPLAPLQVAFGPLALTEAGREQLGREISPINYVTKKLPPTLIIHGDQDEVVPLQQSESFVKKATDAGAKNVELIVRAGKGHGWGDFWKSEEDLNAFADWFDRHLK